VLINGYEFRNTKVMLRELPSCLPPKAQAARQLIPLVWVAASGGHSSV